MVSFIPTTKLSQILLDSLVAGVREAQRQKHLCPFTAEPHPGNSHVCPNLSHIPSAWHIEGV